MTSWTLYMDESGSAGDKKGHYVLGCIAGDSEEIAKLVDRIYYLKLGMAPEKDPNSWEIHSNKIMTGYSPIGARTERKKLAALNAIVETICRSNVTLFGVVIINELARRRGDAAGVYYAPTFIMERFELFVRARGKGGTGHIVSDRMRHGTARNLDRVFAALTRGASPSAHTRLTRTVSLEYASSMSSPPIQLADSLSHSIRRHMGGDERFAGMFAKLKGKMWREGEWSGWKVFPS